ncbi:TBC1 domain family member 15 isoform X2 [Clupea harengus]|uniref:TBC1 domain family member 15 n=1 Tax=Clupea harengus TaxID=7950 RepID=A0A6P8EQM6_CLUHA|nr:TBC1 domain family member 15 isoform X2 [Clupea harengus]
MADSRVAFEHDGVFIHTNPDRQDEQDSLISGCLRVIEKDGDVVVEFKQFEDVADPSNMLCPNKDSSSVVEWKHTVRPPRPLEPQLSCETEWDMVNAVHFRKRSTSTSNGEAPADASPPMAERRSGCLSFSVGDLISIKVRHESWTYLHFNLKEDIPVPALHFHQGGAEALLACLRRYVLLTESPFDSLLLTVGHHSRALSQSFENLLDDTTFGLIQKFRRDPYTTTLGGFSKVTNYLFDALRGGESEPQQREPQDMADLLSEVIPGLDINPQDEMGFEVITRVDLGERPQVRREAPVSREEWVGFLDPEGRVLDPQHLQQRIFKGGVCHSLRKEAWKFLLEYYPWGSTQEMRRSLQRSKTDEYFRMKLQWKSVSEEQEKRNAKLRDHRSLIEKDVNRTDRTNPFYEGDDNPGLILLHDVLMTYCMYDFDLGYVQGMSDLLSPVLYVMENEVDAFWCFVSFMDQMHQNFEEHMQGMKTQLIQLSTLLRLLDPAFWHYLELQDSGYLYFCFRWLLIRFKRELSFHDVLRLWEVMWTGLPCQNFHLLVCCAILDAEKQKIMQERYGFNEILKHINELSMKLNIEEILRKAEAICLQLKNCKGLPTAVAEILGFSSGEPDPDDPAGGAEAAGGTRTSPGAELGSGLGPGPGPRPRAEDGAGAGAGAGAPASVEPGEEDVLGRETPEPFSPSQVLLSEPRFSPSRNGHIRQAAPDAYKLTYLS